VGKTESTSGGKGDGKGALKGGEETKKKIHKGPGLVNKGDTGRKGGPEGSPREKSQAAKTKKTTIRKKGQRTEGEKKGAATKGRGGRGRAEGKKKQAGPTAVHVQKGASLAKEGGPLR